MDLTNQLIADGPTVNQPAVVSSVPVSSQYDDLNPYNCPFKNCDYKGFMWKQYRDHLREKHNREIRRLLWSFWYELFQQVFEEK